MSSKFKLDTPVEDIKLDIRFDITMLNSIIGYLTKKSVHTTKKVLNNVMKLFNAINMKIYENTPNLLYRVLFIKRILEARLIEGFENEASIINYCKGDLENPVIDEIINNLDAYKNLNYNEMKAITKAIEDRLRYLYVLMYTDKFSDNIEKLNSGDFVTYKEINDSMLKLCTAFVNKSRKISTFEAENSLSLTDDDFEDKVTNMVEDMKNPARIIRTGIRSLNDLLGIGYSSKRLYLYMGLPSGFKSGILLKAIIDTKRWNPQLLSRHPNKRPTALLVTMENYLEETVERMFNMVGPSSDIRNFTPKQVIDILRNEGGLKVTDDNNIDIVIKYVPNRTITTQELYVMIDDLEDDDKEVSILVLDYIKRIKPAEYGKDEKEELKNITNELKSLAIDKNIAVVSAHQLNRDAARSVDSAMLANKTDLARYLGRSNVGSALIKGLYRVICTVQQLKLVSA